MRGKERDTVSTFSWSLIVKAGVKKGSRWKELETEGSLFLYLGDTWVCLTTKGSRKTEQISNRKDKQDEEWD